MADTTKPAPAEDESAEDAASEAQIAVHWREEEYFEPPAAFVAQANANDPAILERFGVEHFPDSLRRVRRHADVGSEVGHAAGHEQSAVLQVVRWRAFERLRRIASIGTSRPAAIVMR